MQRAAERGAHLDAEERRIVTRVQHRTQL